MMTPDELRDMDNRLTVIASNPNVSAEDSRYAMACALALIAEVRRLQFAATPDQEDLIAPSP